METKSIEKKEARLLRIGKADVEPGFSTFIGPYSFAITKESMSLKPKEVGIIVYNNHDNVSEVVGSFVSVEGEMVMSQLKNNSKIHILLERVEPVRSDDGYRFKRVGLSMFVDSKIASSLRS